MPNIQQFKLILLTVLLDFLYNISLLIGLKTASPLFISIGCLFVLPLSILSDYLIYQKSVNALCYIGFVLIAVGFIGLNVGPIIEQNKKKKELEEYGKS